MGYALMWLEAMAAALLYVMGVDSILRRMERIPRYVFPCVYLLPLIAISAVYWPLTMASVEAATAFNVAFVLVLAGCISVAVLIARRRGAKRILGVAAAATMPLPLLAGVLATLFAAMLKFGASLETNWFAYALSWTLCFAAAATLLSIYFSRAPAESGTFRPSATMLLMGSALNVLLLLGTFWNLDTSAKMKLENVRMEASALALSVAPARLPDRDNAAIFYKKAFEAFDKVEVKPAVPGAAAQPMKARWHDAGALDFPVQDPEVRDYLSRNKAALVLLRRGSASSGCYFDRDYAQPSVAMQLPELSSLRHAARLLGASARCRAADGDIKGALEAIAAIRNMARHASVEPIMISTLVAISIESIGTAALEGVLRTAQPTTEDLAPLRGQESASFMQSIQRGFRGEEAFGLSYFALLSAPEASPLDMIVDLDQLPGKFSAKTLPPMRALGPAVLPAIRVFMLEDDLAAFRSAMGRCKNLAATPYHEALPHWKALELAAESKRGLFTYLLTPASARFAEAGARCEVTGRLADLGLAAAAFRAKNGHFPDEIGELAPDFISHVPIDCYNGQPLRMKRSGEGVIFYSVGPDLKDDGGTPFKNRDWTTGDATFSVGKVALPNFSSNK